MWSGRVSTRFSRKRRGVLRNLESRTKRRSIKDGYPVEPRAFTREEVDAYLGGQKIECLICGRLFNTLSAHIQRIHSITGDEYRQRYGLPFSTGLASAAERERHSKRSSNPEQLKRMRGLGDQYRHLAHAAVSARGARQPEYAKKERTERALRIAGVDKQYEESDFQKFLDLTLTGVPAKDVAKMPGMPGLTVWYKYRRDNPGFDAKVVKAWDDAPFDVQAKLQVLGKRFAAEVARLSGEGLSQYEIGEKLGVSQSQISLLKTGKLSRLTVDT